MKFLGCIGYVYFLIGANTSAFAVNEALVAKGAIVFRTNCVSCHGENGDGKGRAAVAISGKKPRDFTQGKFLYGSSDAEIFNTITNGVPGTAMPSWLALPEADRRSVIEFIRTLNKNKAKN